MPRNEQLIGAAGAKQLDPYEGRCYYHRVNSIDSDGINWMKIWDRLTIGTAERDVAAQIPDRTARFNSPYDIASCQLLILETDAGLDNDAYAAETPQHLPR
jgi:hypothetical protein